MTRDKCQDDGSASRAPSPPWRRSRPPNPMLETNLQNPWDQDITPAKLSAQCKPAPIGEEPARTPGLLRGRIRSRMRGRAHKLPHLGCKYAALAQRRTKLHLAIRSRSRAGAGWKARDHEEGQVAEEEHLIAARPHTAPPDRRQPGYRGKTFPVHRCRQLFLISTIVSAIEGRVSAILFLFFRFWISIACLIHACLSPNSIRVLATAARSRLSPRHAFLLSYESQHPNQAGREVSDPGAKLKPISGRT